MKYPNSYFSNYNSIHNIQHKAFTMIELVFVILILAIIASIAIPMFSASRESACIANLRSQVRYIQSSANIKLASNIKLGVVGTPTNVESAPDETTTLFEDILPKGRPVNALSGNGCGVRLVSISPNMSTTNSVYSIVAYSVNFNLELNHTSLKLRHTFASDEVCGRNRLCSQVLAIK